MASIAEAARKTPGERRLSDTIRIQAGHMLTYDHLSLGDCVAEKHIMQRVLRKRIVNNTGFMALPLTLAYFVFYTAAVHYHESITRVFFVESLMRLRADDIFLEVSSIDQLWEALSGNFLQTFFYQQDNYGSTLPKSLNKGDKWGLWGRIDTYNQLQAAVRVTTTRRSQQSFGDPYSCKSEITCNLCRNNTGFEVSGSQASNGPFDCGDWNSTQSAANSNGEARRLRLRRPEIRSSLPVSDEDVDNRFKFFLYPSQSQQDILEVLNYYRERKWIDEQTRAMEIQMYLLNCDIGKDGRCLLEQFKLSFSFSSGGGIYYERALVPIWLDLFSGAVNVVIDLCWFVVLVITTFFRGRLAWRAFLQSELFDHFIEPFNAWEWVILMIGWFNVYGVYLMHTIIVDVKDVLGDVRWYGWNLSSSQEGLIEQLFDTVSTKAAQLGNLRIGLDYYVICLMFRFFVSFGAQPRLAFLTKTMRAVTTDMVHFGAVALPTFGAYVVSGTLMFGRKFEGFATLQASFGTCFRISMESEFDWAEWTEDHYYMIACWTWSFILIMVLLMINMVMAIILDIYNEVRETTRSKDAETIWTTIFNLCVRLYHFRGWVPERTLNEKLAQDEEGEQPSIVGMEYLKGRFPHMPDRECNILYADCNRDMRHASEIDLDNRSLLKTAGSLMASLEKVNQVVGGSSNKDEASKDPLQVWTAPHVQRTPVSASGPGEIDSFLTLPAYSKGSRQPRLVNPEPGADSETPAPEPPPGPKPAWLQEVNGLLADQRKWLNHAQWQLEQMQWQVQLGHMSKSVEGGNGAL